VGAEAGDLEVALDLRQLAVGDIGQEQARRVRAHVDDRRAHAGRVRGGLPVPLHRLPTLR